jgi:hypothetical protein
VESGAGEAVGRLVKARSVLLRMLAAPEARIGTIAVKVANHHRDEVLKVFGT